MPRSSRDYEVDSSSKCIFHVIVTADHEVRPAYRRMSDFLTELEVGGAFQLENQWLHSAAVLDSPQASKDQGLSKAVPPFRRSVHSRRDGDHYTGGLRGRYRKGVRLRSGRGCVQLRSGARCAQPLEGCGLSQPAACPSKIGVPEIQRPKTPPYTRILARDTFPPPTKQFHQKLQLTSRLLRVLILASHTCFCSLLPWFAAKNAGVLHWNFTARCSHSVPSKCCPDRNNKSVPITPHNFAPHLSTASECERIVCMAPRLTYTTHMGCTPPAA
jgi:hypothetical protein